MTDAVLITGASSGIGRELAFIAAASSRHLVLVARDLNKLEELAVRIEASDSCQVLVVQADLSIPGAAAQIFERVEAAGLRVDRLINNAGAGITGPYLGQPPDADYKTVMLNIVAVMDLCRLFGQDMIRRGRGRILNVASTGSFQPGPFIAVYYASKAFVHSYSLALANEWRGSGVSVGVLYPGATATDFARRAGKADLRHVMSARKVAETAWRGMNSGKLQIIPGAGNKLAVFLSRLLPARTLAASVRKIQQRQYELFRS